MISFETACKLAYEYWYEKDINFKMGDAVDIGDGWVFGNEWRKPLEPGELRAPLAGWKPPYVMKETGEMGPYQIPPMENLERLQKGKRLEVPEEYKV